jgi:hypothetical protein
MCRKFVLLMFLFTFVASSALADDVAPPYWAGGSTETWSAAEFFHWTFEEEPLLLDYEIVVAPPAEQSYFGTDPWDIWPEWSWLETDQDEAFQWIVEDYGDQFPSIFVEDWEVCLGMMFFGYGVDWEIVEWENSFQGRQGVIKTGYVEAHWFGFGDITASSSIQVQVTYAPLNGAVDLMCGYGNQDGGEEWISPTEVIPSTEGWSTAVFELFLDYSTGGFQTVGF